MPRNARPTTVYPIALRELEVTGITDLTPGLRRITLGGDQLRAFTTGEGIEVAEFVSTGFDDDIRLFFPYPGQTEPVLPTPKDGGLKFGKDPRPLSRAYTVRRYDAEAGELDLDFIKHGVGVATTWAYRTTIGARLHIAGPPTSLGLPAGSDWLLVVGDDTALPAIARLLEELPEDAEALVFIELAEESLRIELRELPGVEVRWMYRDGALAGTTTLLLDAVRQAPWRPGNVFAWLAGEQSTVRDLRRHLIEDRGLDKTMISFTGYWKRQQVISLDDDTAVPDPERNEEAFSRFHEMAELMPPIAIRTAANLDLGEHLSRGVSTVPELAAATGTDERALGKFLRYLQALELLESDTDGYRLSETGEFLTNVYVLDVIRRDGVVAQQERAVFGLEEALRTGRASYASVTGQDFDSLREDPQFEHKLLEQRAEFAPYLAVPLSEARAFLGVRSVVVHSIGAASIAAALVSHLPDVSVTIPAMPATASWLRDDLPRTIPQPEQLARITVAEQAVTDPTPNTEAIVMVHTLQSYPDPDAVLVLRRAAASLTPGGRILLLENEFSTEELNEHQAEDDLLCLALHGSGRRTAAEFDAVITEAGLTTVETEAVGWGNLLRTLTPAG